MFCFPCSRYTYFPLTAPLNTLHSLVLFRKIIQSSYEADHSEFVGASNVSVDHGYGIYRLPRNLYTPDVIVVFYRMHDKTVSCLTDAILSLLFLVHDYFYSLLQRISMYAQMNS